LRPNFCQLSVRFIQKIWKFSSNVLFAWKQTHSKSYFFQGLGPIWSGWTDQLDEGIFANENIPAMKLKESNMSDTWYKGEPNGGRGENCAIMVVSKIIF
jgi:hypothetical protein